MSNEWYDKYAKVAGVKVSKDAKVVLEGLQRNKEKHGAKYCPCRLDRTPDTICPCKEMKETKHCHCNLFTPK